MASKGQMRGLSTDHLDAKVLAALPDVDAVLIVEKLKHESQWAKSFRITIRTMDLNEENFFIKISVGHHGREALKGEFTSTSAMSSVVPGFCPEPIAWGTFESDQDIHFYMCKFYNFHNDGRMPNPESFCQNLANLHKKSESPNRKFGFDCTTYNGDLPQNNTWHDSWEAFFANGLRHILDVRKARAGPHPAELEKLLPTLFDVVIPRLLRPLESNGRKVKPSLVHGDLWYGNASVLVESDQAIVYDPASFYAHNEYELGNWLPPRNKFNKAYFDAYHSLVEKSEPKEDYDDRNSLYSLRFNLHAATLFPDDDSYLEMAIKDITELNEKFCVTNAT